MRITEWHEPAAASWRTLKFPAEFDTTGMTLIVDCVDDKIN